MLTLWLALGAVSAPPGPQRPPPTAIAPSEADTTSIRRIIDEQIDAFQRDDPIGAWAHLSPGLRAQFGTPERFLQLVRDHYQPVYRPRSYRHGALRPVDGGWGQLLHVVGPDGRRVEALYLLQQQPDGSWRTHGCLLLEPETSPPQA